MTLYCWLYFIFDSRGFLAPARPGSSLTCGLIGQALPHIIAFPCGQAAGLLHGNPSKMPRYGTKLPITSGDKSHSAGSRQLACSICKVAMCSPLCSTATIGQTPVALVSTHALRAVHLGCHHGPRAQGCAKVTRQLVLPPVLQPCTAPWLFMHSHPAGSCSIAWLALAVSVRGLLRRSAR